MIPVLLRQTSIEVRLWLRRRETVIFSLALPVLFLLFFGALYGSNHVPESHVKYIDYIVPGYAVYAIMAVALGTVSANLAGERHFGILKRLGGTPIPRLALICAKVTAAAVLVAGVIGVLIIVGVIGYNVKLQGSQPAAIAVLAIGVFTFGSIGITLGGIVKADSAVAAGSLLYLAFSFLGGVFVPQSQFPKALHTIAQFLPSERMVHAMQSIWSEGGGISSAGQDIFVMLCWAAAALALSLRFFKWE